MPPRFLVASLLLLCLATQSTLAQYGRSAPTSSSSGYKSPASLRKPTSKPSTTGGYGGSYGAIYDNPSGTADVIDQLEEGDEELEEVEQPPPQVSGPAPIRAGYGTFRGPSSAVESAASASSQLSASNAFNGPRTYAPAQRPSNAFGRQSFTTARPRRVSQEEEVLPLEEGAPVDEFEQVSTFKQQARSTAINYGRPTYSGPAGSTQFGVQQGPQTSQRQRNAVVYGGSVPQLFGSSAERDFGDDNDDDDSDDEPEQTVDSAELPEVSGNQYAGQTSARSKKRTGGAGQSYGGSSFLGSSKQQQQQRRQQKTRPSGPINAAIQSTHELKFRDVASSSAPAEPVTIEVAPNQNEIQFRFNSASSKLNIESVHEPSPGSYSETSSEDEPHYLKHTVTRPIVQEVREIVVPTRTVVTEIQPVQENVQTIVARGEPKAKQSAAAAAAGGGKAKATGNQRSSSSGGYGRPPAASAQSINTFNSPSAPKTSNGFAGYGASQFASPSAKPKKNGNGNGQYSTPVGSNGQAMLTMSFNYGPAAGGSSSSSNGFNGASSSSRSGYGSSRSAQVSGKQSRPTATLGASSQTRSGGYGSVSSFSDDQQSTGSISVDRVGNGVAYKMMTFTMGSDAMKQQQQQSGGSSSRSGYGSSARSAQLLFSGADQSSSGGGRRRSISSSAATANARPLGRISSTDALIEDELDNGEINVPVPLTDEPTVAAATGGTFFVASKPKSAASSGYRGQLGRTRNTYKSRAA